MPDFTHTQEAIDHAQAEMGWTGFDLDDFARRSRPDPPWKGVGIVPASGVHRDSDALARSNASVIIEDFASADIPINTVRRSHPMVGWSEVTYYDATDAGNQLAEHWRDKLANYPVADEDHYSELETTELTEYVYGEVSDSRPDCAIGADGREYPDPGDSESEIPLADLCEFVCSYVFEDCSSVDCLSDSAITHAIGECYEQFYDKLATDLRNPQTENLLNLPELS